MRVADRRNMFSGSKCVANHREEQSAGQTKMLWITLALIAAACTSLTVIFAKIGIKYVNSDFATFYRTGIVVVFSLILCAISGTLNAASSLTAENFVFLGLSGIATGCSWLCYYKAIKLGDVNKVAPVDKSSFVLSSLLFLIFFFDETTKNGDPLTLCVLLLSVALTLLGTLLMIAPQNAVRKHTNGSERKALPEGNGVNRADGTNFTGENLAERPSKRQKGKSGGFSMPLIPPFLPPSFPFSSNSACATFRRRSGLFFVRSWCLSFLARSWRGGKNTAVSARYRENRGCFCLFRESLRAARGSANMPRWA